MKRTINIATTIMLAAMTTLAAAATKDAKKDDKKAPAAQPAVAAPAEAYTLKDGIILVPLVIRENQGIERKDWPTTFGVPMPLGILKETAALRLLDSKGDEVPCQFTVLSRYWGRDNSVRWVLLDFQANVPAGGSSTYRLANDKPAAQVKGGIEVKDEADAVTVTSGKIKTVVSKKRCSLFESVSVDGKEVVAAAEHDGPRATTDAQDFSHYFGGDWNLHGWDNMRSEEGKNPIKRADYFGDIGAPDEVFVERNGPIHTIVRVRGAYRPGEQGEGVLKHGPYNFTYRLHFYKDKDYVGVEHSVENSRFEEPRFQTKLLDHSLWTTLKLGDKTTVKYGGDGQAKDVEAGKDASTVGDPATRWVDVSAGDLHVGVGSRLPLGEPGAIDVAGGKLAVRPYSIYYGEAHPLTNMTSKSWGSGGFQMDFGSRTTYYLYYRFAKGEGTDIAMLSKGMLWPLFGFAPPAWYADTGVWNMELSPNNKMNPRIKDGQPFDLGSKEAQGLFKKWDFNSGGHHGNLSSINDATLMTGNLTSLQHNWAVINHAIDFYQWNYRGHEPSTDAKRLAHAHRMIMFGPKDFYMYGKRGQNSGTSFQSYKYLPDFEHYGFLHLFEHYYLWGDMRARESLMRFANFAVTFEWDVMFHRETVKGEWWMGSAKPEGGENSGIPSLNRVDYFDKHPDALRRSHYARIYSWQLYTPLQAFQATGDPVYDLLTKWQLRRLSHLQRLSRGIPEAWVPRYWDSNAQKMWKEIPYPKDVTDFEYSAQQWMIGKTMLGFHEAYKTYGDEEILDNIWGTMDYFTQVPWIGPGKGIPNGPSIPATLMGKDYNDKKFAPNYHMRTGQALALAWYYTGNQEIKKRMQDHVDGKVENNTWGHLTAWVKSRKGDRDKLPEAVTDLKCTSDSRDGLKFEWTAPKAYGASGKAVKYFLKFSTKPIVQWAQVNNPEAPDDPWLDNKMHKYKPECWHPDFMKKDAFWMATHVEGEPTPGEPGKKESCTVTITKPHGHYGLPLDKMPRIKDLPAGDYCFAVGSYDEDNNLSPISNVITVTLK